ncbi:MAG: hypothetical protein UZ13_03005 [Chloroflexi bacterium OLB13]|jgi:hypothetical protein|nr:MAG: hypothetical protein UZ13_03005 [Chloroflexi bacterium OLB13]
MIDDSPFARFLHETDALSALPDYPDQRDPEPMYDPIAVLGAETIRDCRKHITPEQAASYDSTGQYIIHFLSQYWVLVGESPNGFPVYTLGFEELSLLCLLSVGSSTKRVHPNLCIDCDVAVRLIYFGRNIAQDEVFNLDTVELQHLVDMMLFCYQSAGV